MLLLNNTANAQKEGNNWVLSSGVGLDFNTIPTELFYIASQDTGMFSAVSDSEGALLAYSNGFNIWNGDGELVTPEGFVEDIINLSWNTGNYQSILIVKLESSISILYAKYNVFENDLYLAELEESGLNIIFQDSLIVGDEEGYWQQNRLIAIKHGNGRDWWIVNQAYLTTDWPTSDGDAIYFYSYLLAENSSGHLVINEGDYLSNGYGFEVMGEMISSNNGDYIVKAHGKELLLYSFDRCAGQLSLMEVISDVDMISGFGVAFSPDDSKLYVTTYSSFNGLGLPYSPSSILQYCLDCGMDIASTKDTIYQFPTKNFQFYGMKLGPDGKIYLTAGKIDLGVDDPLSDYQTHFWVINHPDSLGAACDLDTASISSGGRDLSSSFPNIPNYQLGSWRGSPCDTLDDTNPVAELTSLPFKAYPNPVQDYLYIDNPLQTTCQAVVYNAMGQEVERFDLEQAGQTISTTSWPTGFYQLIIQQHNHIVWRQSVVKME